MTAAQGRSQRCWRLLLRFAPVLFILASVPCAVGFATGDTATGWRLLPSALLLGGLSCLTFRKPPPDDATLTENAVAVGLAFPVAAVLSSAPYLAHGLSALDALFEGISGITSTGLTRYADPSAHPFGVNFLRAWQEWIGGYVIVTATIALLPGAADGPTGMAQSDIGDDGGPGGEIDPVMKKRAFGVTVAYVGLTALCILIVRVTGQDFGFSVVHALTAVSTGGFSSLEGSLGAVAPRTVWVLMAFSILGAVAISGYVRPFADGVGAKKLAATLLAVVLLSGVWGTVVLLAEGGAASPYEAFQLAASAQTTTGYAVTKVADLSDVSKLALSASMFVGGDIGSTAGGLKLMRLFAIGLLIAAALRGAAARQGSQKRSEAKDGLRLIAWWGALTVLGWSALILLGHAPVDALFEWTSALNNSGLSVGVSSGPDVSVGTRLVVIMAMWLGRIEILAALLVFRLLRG